MAKIFRCMIFLFLLAGSFRNASGQSPITADNLIYFYNSDYDTWERTMAASGMVIAENGEAMDREDGPLYIAGDPTGVVQMMSKSREQVFLGVLNNIDDTRYLSDLFDEVSSGGVFLGREADNDYYLYKGICFGLQYVDEGYYREEAIYVFVWDR